MNCYVQDIAGKEKLDTLIIGASNASKFYNTFLKTKKGIEFIYLSNIFNCNVEPVVSKISSTIRKPTRLVIFLNSNRILPCLKFLENEELHVHETKRKWVKCKEKDKIQRILTNYKKLFLAFPFDHIVLLPHFYRSFLPTCKCKNAFRISYWKQRNIYQKVETSIKQTLTDYDIRFVFIEHDWIFPEKKFWLNYPLKTDQIHFLDSGLRKIHEVFFFILNI